ncbi:class I SAM-dependent methyltransferase [Halobacteriovorax sp. GB3]|uniref:class I SAM-dependent methyltransferase n=1 Tax=Halobacteriovorax sp. GB3 TaxID=2719615 RepID=UPI00235E3837|nr:class I SAM-dependent methyltransferase [Halobacteriovorax sp. GB3]MDD0852803.1 class I SAM-dependent methyltransferase [Halobacteriovorax sp. GB3]
MSENILKNRLIKIYKHRKKWAKKNKIEAYRLYERDIPEFPLIFDIYANNVVIYDQSDSRDNQKELLQLAKEAALGLDFQEENIVIKERKKRHGLEQHTKIDDSKNSFFINEGPIRLEVNIHDYLDTGIFLDHRPMRQLFQSMNLTNKKFLNLFSYTSSIGLSAAYSGAKTTNVDLSKTYLAWSKRNYEHNEIPLNDHHFVNADILEYLKNYEGSKYDYIFLDPPTFSNSKKMQETFSVENHQVFLIEHCMNLLNEGGTLYFSNNKRGFKLDSEIEAKYAPSEISHKTIPEDFRNKKIHVCYEFKKGYHQS